MVNSLKKPRQKSNRELSIDAGPIRYTGREQMAMMFLNDVKFACRSLARAKGLTITVVATLALAFLLSRPPWYAVVVPLTVTAMILTIAYNPQFALLLSLSLALATAVSLGTDLGQLLVMTGGLATILNTYVGYKKAAEVQKQAVKEKRWVIDLVREQKLVDEETLKKILDPKALTEPGRG